MARRILYAAPPWKPARSSVLKLWHGTIATAAADIMRNGVNLVHAAPRTDFGAGFYTTTLRRQAAQWAWFSQQGKNRKPALVRFEVARELLASLQSLQFILGDDRSLDFWSLVQHCRQGGDHRRANGGPWYDVVSGPVAAMWKQRVAMQGADQYSFHTDAAVSMLNGCRRVLDVNL